MAVSNGRSGEGSSARSVITAAPGTAEFEGVWLIGEAWGRQAASPNVGLTLDGQGLTVTGPARGQKNTIPWTWVQHFGHGDPMTFPDGRSATVVEVTLIGRNITLLVPPDQLRQDEVDELNRYVPEQTVVADPSPLDSSTGSDLLAGTAEIEDVDLTTAPSKSGKSAKSTKSDKSAESGKKTKMSAERSAATTHTRTLRLGLLLAGLVVVAVVGTVIVAVRIHGNQNSNAAVVIPQVTPTTQPPPPSTLTGPAASVSALSVAENVNVTLADLPSGWAHVVVPASTAAISPFADRKSVAAAELASCAKIPLSQVGVLTGSTEPGGPEILPSQIYVQDSGNDPSAISVTSLDSSAAVEQSDLASLLAPGVSRCLASYYATSFANERVTSTPVVNRFAVPEHAGEEVIGLDVHIGISLNGHPSVYDYDLVIIGAGRLEVALGAQQDNEPIPTTTLFPALQSMETRAAAAAGGH